MTINKENCKKRKTERKIPFSVKVPESASKFMSEKGYSPTAIFMEALVELGYKQ